MTILVTGGAGFTPFFYSSFKEYGVETHSSRRSVQFYERMSL